MAFSSFFSVYPADKIPILPGVQESISSLAATADTTEVTADTTTTAMIITSMPPINTNMQNASFPYGK